MQGFTFFLRGKDYFVETPQVKKTANLAKKVLPLIGCSITDGNIKAILYRMARAKCEIHTCQNATRECKQYYEISGEGFGGRGSWLDDGETVILKVD